MQTGFYKTYKRDFHFAKSPGFILFLLLDNLIDDYAESITRLDEISEEIDDRIQKNFTKEINYDILDFKISIFTRTI